MRLLELIDHGLLRIGSHTRRAQLVDGPAFGEQVPADADDFEARGLEHLLRGIGHIGGHLALVIAELVVEAEHRNSPPVFHDRVKIHVVFVSRKHLAEAAHLDERAGAVPHLLLERRAETGRLHGMAREDLHAAAAFESVAANVIRSLLVQIAEARQVEMPGLAVVESVWLAD